MSDCFDTDTLATLGAAFGWRTAEALRHLSECGDCRQRLDHLAAVRAALDARLSPAPGFSERALAAMGMTGPARSPVRRFGPALSLMNTVLAGAVAFFALQLVSAFGGGGGGGPVEPSLLSLLIASLVVAAGFLTLDIRGRNRTGTSGSAGGREPVSG